MSDLKKQIEDAARQYANKTQFMSNYPHDWNSAYDGYIQGAMDTLQTKQANRVLNEPQGDTCNMPHVSNSVCDACGCERPITLKKCGNCGNTIDIIKQTDC